ncbi:hypothetical protein C8P63_10119 [Melghirimyces profundicolus]|uniref:Cof subfamily protein (Haloacid dehalogenase superfamily)/HAD superfamily hydrolase (TIGR01484 family) n=1 Tax=Melghirimyces profundicolus TaxID=1242148 RepID=A0A2T6C945_9BACL|nr:HAD family hydrolase [Melghirimyces profundicolus]PTX64803.1 hypothetical protein C8P63_10119 [Melghirimyces profundicolus]
MIRLIVCDLDGTLLDEEKRVSKEDREALEKAVDRGVEICLASGRMQAELDQVAREMGIPAHGVSQNGSFVRTKEGESLHHTVFPLELALEIFDRTRGVDLFSIVCFEHHLWSPEDHAYAGVVRERLFAPVEVVENLRDQLNGGLLPCKFSYFGDLEACKKLKEELDRRFPGEIDTFISDRDCLDVMPVGVSKGNGLKALIRHLGIGSDEVMCMGDAFNDVSMFRCFPRHSYAMDHAPEGVRREAAHTVPSVAAALDRAFGD